MGQDPSASVAGGVSGSLTTRPPSPGSAGGALDPPDRTRPGTWLLRLFLRPSLFVASIPKGIPVSPVIFSTLIAGVASGLIGYLSPERRAQLPTVAREAYIAGLIIGSAVFGGLVWYCLGGSWYVLRLVLCGAARFRHGLARRAYITIQLIYTLPCHRPVVGVTPLRGDSGFGAPRIMRRHAAQQLPYL